MGQSLIVSLLMVAVWWSTLHIYSASRPGDDNPKVLVINDFSSSDARPKVILLELVAKNWTSAEDECAAYKNGSLAVIQSADDLQDMFWLYLTHEIYIHYADNDSYAAVGYRRRPDGSIVDVAGEPLELTNHTYWADGEPSASGDCGALYRDEGLSMVPCDMALAFFCQYSL